jgi:hypothetical protein
MHQDSDLGLHLVEDSKSKKYLDQDQQEKCHLMYLPKSSLSYSSVFQSAFE